ncbi:MAG TPA: HNH endonuclease [Kofleriaceae bacterium]|nr:HNH endonuclease [Kofleriaceae bacterium]
MVAYAFPQLVVSVAREVDEWQSVHRRLRRIAKRRAALDREELELIREAIRIALWRYVGVTGIREYLELECGYGPHVASERVRVAEALDAMPALEAALGEGELSYSAVRAISRVATNRTEDEWIAACRGKSQREIEELLAEREVGDRPGAPRKPELRAKDRTYRGITAATEAAIECARCELQEELGERLDDNQLLALLANRARTGGAPRKKAAAQVAVTVCPSCQVGRQLAGNRQVTLRPEELARVFCDAQWVDVNGKERSVQDVTPALRAKVMLRDHGKCRVPGCRAAANIEVHHIVPREQGGAHTLENLIALCDGHHVALHRGDITIDGPAERAVITNCATALVHVDKRSDQASDADEDTVHVNNRSDQMTHARADAVLALTTLGFTKGEAMRAVDAALDERPASLEALVRGALRRCAPTAATTRTSDGTS